MYANSRAYITWKQDSNLLTSVEFEEVVLMKI
jgi:hypothetical protein